MPLLLASEFKFFKQKDIFKDSLASWKVACITTAALGQMGEKTIRPEWMDKEIQPIKELSGQFFEYDLNRKNISDLNNDLLDCDLIYFIGGNTYCLLDAVNKSGFRQFAPDHLSQGKSIWGGSAGAVIMCPNIDYIRAMDEPEKSSLQDYSGLGLTDLYILPHWKGDYQEQAQECLAKNPNLEITCLTDAQAIYIDGNRIEVL